MSDLYRRCEKCDGERLISNIDTGLIDRCDCREGFLPDDTLQQIADAPRCEHGNIYRHKLYFFKEWRWCEGAPGSAALLNTLVEGKEHE